MSERPTTSVMGPDVALACTTTEGIGGAGAGTGRREMRDSCCSCCCSCEERIGIIGAVVG